MSINWTKEQAEQGALSLPQGSAQASRTDVKHVDTLVLMGHDAQKEGWY